MPNDPRLDNLLSLCEARLRDGHPIDLAELCPDSDLRPELERRWRALVSMDGVQAGPGTDGDGSFQTGPATTTQTSPPPLKGPVVSGYEILGELGRGGMGVVYKARQVRAGRLVALKMLLPGAQMHRDELTRFEREAKAAAELRHPAIAQVHDVGEHEGQPFFSMELCDGGSLKSHLAGTPLTPEEAARVMIPLAEAMEEAHQHQILHRDLKPANVLLAKVSGGRKPPGGEQSLGGSRSSLADSRTPLAGQQSGSSRTSLADSRPPLAEFLPKISDFGLAKKLDEPGLTSTGAVMGTPSYMPPEQAEGKIPELTPAADVYALGAILYECLTGRPPFRAANVPATLKQVIENEPVTPRTLQPSTPRDLDTICLKCLRKDPRQRYATAGELADDLRRFLDGKPVHARPVSALERGWRWCRRNPAAAIAATVTVVSLLLLVPGAALLYAARQGERSAREIAIAREYSEHLTQARQRPTLMRPGWRDANLNGLREASQLETSLRDAAELRTEVAATLAGVELVEKRVLHPRFDAVLAFSPDGKRLAAAQRSAPLVKLFGSVLLIDVDTGKEVKTLSYTVHPTFNPLSDKGHDGARSVAFSPDGKRLAMGLRTGGVYCWDLEDDRAKPVTWSVGDRKAVEDLIFTPDGQGLFTLVASDKAVIRWDVRTGKEQVRYKSGQGALAFAVSPDGRQLGCTDDGKLVVLDSATLLARPTQLPRDCGVLCYSPDGRLLAVESRHRILLLNPGTGEELRTLQDPDLGGAHEYGPDHLAFNADGSLLISTSRADTERSIKLWETASGRLVGSSLIGSRSFQSAAVSPVGPLVAVVVATDEETPTRDKAAQVHPRVLLYEITGLHEQTFLGRHSLPLLNACFSPDGQFLAALDRGELAVWVTANGRRRALLTCDPLHGPGRHSLSYSPRGDALAFCRRDRSFSVWDLGNGRGTKDVAAKDTDCLTFAPDDRTIWAVVDDNIVQSWRGPESTPAARYFNLELTGQSAIRSLAVGTQWVLAGGVDGRVRLLRPSNGEVVDSFDGVGNSPVRSVALSPDERLVVFGTQQGTMRIVELEGRTVVDDLEGHSDSVQSLAFSGDGKLLATGSRDRSVRLYQRRGFRLDYVLTLRFPSGPVERVFFHPDGTKLGVLIRNETGVRIWHLDRLRAQLRAMDLDWQDGPELWGPARPVEPAPLPEAETDALQDAAKALERGEHLLQSGDRGAGLLWLVKAVELSGEGNAKVRQFALAKLAPDVRLAAPLLVIDTPSNLNFVAVRPDGKVLATAGQKGAQLWDAHTGKPLGQPLDHDGSVDRVVFTPDGKHALTVGRVGTVRCWNAGSGAPVGTPLPHPDQMDTLAMHPEGKVFATGCKDGLIRFWDLDAFLDPAKSAKPPPTQHIGRRILGLGYSPNGRQLLVGLYKHSKVMCWDLAARPPTSRDIPHAGSVDMVAFSPDGRLIATATDPDARLWDNETLQPVGVPMLHTRFIAALAFRPDGKVLATGSDDTSVRLWEVPTGRLLAPPLVHPDKIGGVAFTPDGTRLVTGCHDGKVRIWDATIRPHEGTMEQAVLRAQIESGLELTVQGHVRGLSLEELATRIKQLRNLDEAP